MLVALVVLGRAIESPALVVAALALAVAVMAVAAGLPASDDA